MAKRVKTRAQEDRAHRDAMRRHQASAEKVARVFRETRQYDAAIHEIWERAAFIRSGQGVIISEEDK